MNSSAFGREVAGSNILASYFGDLKRHRGDFSLEQVNLFMRALRHAGISDELLQATIDESKNDELKEEKENHFANAVAWSLLKEMYPINKDEEIAGAIMGKNFIPSVFNRAFLGLGKKEKIPPIPFSKETLEKCKKDHILLLGPFSEKGKPPTLHNIIFNTGSRWFTWNNEDTKEIFNSLNSTVPYRWIIIWKKFVNIPIAEEKYEIPSAATTIYAAKIWYEYNMYHLHDIKNPEILFEGIRLYCHDLKISIREFGGDMGSTGPEMGVWVNGKDDYKEKEETGFGKEYARPRPKNGLGVTEYNAVPLIRKPDSNSLSPI